MQVALPLGFKSDIRTHNKKGHRKGSYIMEVRHALAEM
jgi:hypothetical protein